MCFHSLNVQAVCGPSMEFLDIVVRWPGSAHDSRIFNSSSVKMRYETKEILGNKVFLLKMPMFNKNRSTYEI